MKKVIQKISAISYVTTVTLLLFALVLNGANAAERIYKESQQTDEKQEIIQLEDSLEPAPPTPEEMPGNMNSSSKANSEEYAYLLAAYFTPTFDQNYKSNLKDNLKESLVSTLKRSSKNNLKSSLALISPIKGREFTLVGSKPSGTS